MSVKKEILHKIIDELPEQELISALRYLQFLRNLGEDPVVTALNAAVIDEEIISEEEAVVSDSSWEDYLNGNDLGKTLDDYSSEVHE